MCDVLDTMNTQNTKLQIAMAGLFYSDAEKAKKHPFCTPPSLSFPSLSLLLLSLSALLHLPSFSSS